MDRLRFSYRHIGFDSFCESGNKLEGCWWFSVCGTGAVLQGSFMLMATATNSAFLVVFLIVVACYWDAKAALQFT